MSTELKKPGKWVTNVHKEHYWTDTQLHKFVVGLPEASEVYSVADLVNQGMVGLYEAEEPCPDLTITIKPKDTRNDDPK